MMGSACHPASLQEVFCAVADVPLDAELPHLVLVSQFRDVPLEKPPPRPPTPPWKNVRRYLWDPDLTSMLQTGPGRSPGVEVTVGMVLLGA